MLSFEKRFFGEMRKDKYAVSKLSIFAARNATSI